MEMVRDRRWFHWTVTGVAAIVSLGAFLALRLPYARDVARIYSFEAFCSRVQPPDPFPCHTDFSSRALVYLAASAIFWLALVLGPVILAFAGRGWLSLTPLGALAATVVGLGVAGWWGSGPSAALAWLGPGGADIALGTGTSAPTLAQGTVALLLFAVPAAAVLAWRGRRRAEHGVRWLPVLACGAAAMAVLLIGNGRVVEPGAIAGEGISLVIPGSMIAVFGLLISGRRAWWPWSIALLAVLLSMGPASLAMSSAVAQPTTLWFGTAAWLAAIGGVASLHEPLARIAQRSRAESDRPASGSGHRVRPIVVVNALAFGLLAVSVVAASADPLPARFETSLPTFLGVRVRAETARAIGNIDIALDGFDRYRRAGRDPATFTSPTAGVSHPLFHGEMTQRGRTTCGSWPPARDSSGSSWTTASSSAVRRARATGGHPPTACRPTGRMLERERSMRAA